MGKEKSKPDARVIKAGKIEQRIFLIRNEKVIIDSDLADFYHVSTKRLNEQVKRNIHRFPVDFMFQLTAKEKSEVVANCDHLNKMKYSRSLPYAFTEHGAIMAAGILNSPFAVEASIYIVRAFVKLRRFFALNAEISKRIDALEYQLADHDHQIIALVETIKELMDPSPVPHKRRIGF